MIYPLNYEFIILKWVLVTGKTEYTEYSIGQHIWCLEKLNKNSKILSFEKLYLLNVLIFVKNDSYTILNSFIRFLRISNQSLVFE